MRFPKPRTHVDDIGWFGAQLPARGLVWCPAGLRASVFVCSKCNASRMLVWAPPRPRNDSPHLTPCDNELDGVRCGGRFEWKLGHALPPTPAGR
jgi:hypothetical protein